MEFDVNAIVHFQAYKDCEPIKAKVVGYATTLFEGDDRIFYKLSGISKPLMSTTTGLSIVESKLFNPVLNQDFFK